MFISAHRRATLVLGLPLVGGHLAQFLIGLTDTVMLGWYGVQELASLVLGGSFFFFFLLAGSGFAWAVMPLVAAFADAGDEQMVRRTTRMGLWLSGFFFLACLPVFWFAEPLLLLMGQDPVLADMAHTYLRIAGWGLLPALVLMTLKSYLAALERTAVVMWVTVGAAGVNALANYVLIFGSFGAPEMGIEGAAIASLVTQIVSVGVVLGYAQAVLPQHALFQRFWRPDAEILAKVFRLGVPIGITSLAETGLFVAVSLMMGWLGTIALAAHGIVMQLATAAFMLHLGISNAVTVRAAQAYARKDSVFLLRAGIAGLQVSVAISVVTVAVFLAAPEPLLLAFMDPDEPKRDAILVVGVSLVAMAALFQLFDGAQVVALGLLRGVQDTQVPMIMAAVAYWGIGLPAAYLLGFLFDFGAIGVWSGLVLGLLIAALLLLARFWIHAVPYLASAKIRQQPAPNLR